MASPRGVHDDPRFVVTWDEGEEEDTGGAEGCSLESESGSDTGSDDPRGGEDSGEEEEEGEEEGEEEEEEEEEEEDGHEEENDEGDNTLGGVLTEEMRGAALEEFKKAQEKCGVIYLSSIPIGMGPGALRKLMSDAGERKLHGGSKKRRFVDGWVEFKDKRVAKAVARGWNGTAIGGGARVPYRFELWNIRYLAKFKWYHLTERIDYERKVRDARLRTELSQSKRENEAYFQRVHQAKRQGKKRKRDALGEEGAGEEKPFFRPQPHQRPVISREIPGKHQSKRRKLNSNGNKNAGRPQQDATS